MALWTQSIATIIVDGQMIFFLKKSRLYYIYNDRHRHYYIIQACVKIYIRTSCIRIRWYDWQEVIEWLMTVSTKVIIKFNLGSTNSSSFSNSKNYWNSISFVTNFFVVLLNDMILSIEGFMNRSTRILFIAVLIMYIYIYIKNKSI